MKKFIFLLAVPLLMISCKEKEDKDEHVEHDDEAKQTAVTLPYTASYSSSFKMGNPEYAKTILQGSWKDWENNNLDNMKSWIADTIVAYHSNNKMVQGADSLMANWKRARAKYSSSIDTIDAVFSVYSTDKKENWVLVWATAIDTKLDGTKDTVGVMETWRINKDGKADFLLQYDRANRKE